MKFSFVSAKYWYNFIKLIPLYLKFCIWLFDRVNISSYGRVNIFLYILFLRVMAYALVKSDGQDLLVLMYNYILDIYFHVLWRRVVTYWPRRNRQIGRPGLLNLWFGIRRFILKYYQLKNYCPKLWAVMLCC